MEAQAITEVEIKEQQLVIAQWMQSRKRLLALLNQELPWRIREWIYLCALDQMPAEILEKMPTWELRKNPKRADGNPAEKISGYRFIGTGNERKSGSAGNPGCQ